MVARTETCVRVQDTRHYMLGSKHKTISPKFLHQTLFKNMLQHIRLRPSSHLLAVRRINMETDSSYHGRQPLIEMHVNLKAHLH